MKQLISENLEQFIERERYKYSFPLTQDIEVEKDLGITGDDAVEFISAFGKEFNVDVSLFPVSDYFDAEGLDTIGFILSIFKKNTKSKKSLKLKDLDDAISRKFL